MALLTFLVLPAIAHAQIQSGVFDTQTEVAGNATGLDGTTDVRVLFMTVIQYSLGLLGTVFLLLIVLAGYWYLIARGRDEFISKAKITLVRGVVGMIIILISYSITTFIKNAISYVG